VVSPVDNARFLGKYRGEVPTYFICLSIFRLIVSFFDLTHRVVNYSQMCGVTGAIRVTLLDRLTRQTHMRVMIRSKSVDIFLPTCKE